jgi:hypothetical protein
VRNFINHVPGSVRDYIVGAGTINPMPVYTYNTFIESDSIALASDAAAVYSDLCHALHAMRNDMMHAGSVQAADGKARTIHGERHSGGGTGRAREEKTGSEERVR